MHDTPTPDTEVDFEKADMILAEALERFQVEGVNPYVYGSALMEIGIAALVKAGESEATITGLAREVAGRLAGMMGEFPAPRS